VATAPEFLAYRLKLREMRTPPAERLYCHDREGCGMFLSLSPRQLPSGGGLGLAQEWRRTRRVTGVKCPLCGGRTCSRCGGKAHVFGISGGGNRLEGTGMWYTVPLGVRLVRES
jgi:hypothetical protein